MFAYSFYANTSLFLEEAFADLNSWLKNRKALRKSEDPAAKQHSPLLRKDFHERKPELLIAVITIVALEFVFAGVVGSSIVTTVNFLKLAHQ